MDKLSELKAVAMAVTPGPWVSVDDEWSDGYHANITNEERSDSSIIAIAQVDGGGSESDFDDPFRTEQQANAAFIAAANPAAILELLADNEAKDKRIAELEAKTAMTMGVGDGGGSLFVHGDYDSIKAAQSIVFENESLRAKLATPVRLKKVDSSNVPFAGDGFNAAVDYCAKSVRAAGFTVEGDE